MIDLFAGGGGASLGIEWACGRSPDVAVNHDAEAIAMHAKNHPQTRHLHGDVWAYAPRTVTEGRAVDLLWASPTCIHFSRAKGGKLLDAKTRSLAWVVVRWAKEARPRVICLENVSEFATWGPLHKDGTRDRSRMGFTFRRWVRAIEREGYVVEWRNLRACDYGSPTTRTRLFLVARRDGLPIAWPTPTHGPQHTLFLSTWRTAAECIDFTLPCPSIYARKRPLAPATMRRIERGIRRFVTVENPFTLIQTGYGERDGQAPRALDLNAPLGTVVAGGVKHALVRAFIAKHYGGNETPGQDLRRPLGTVTTVDHHALVTAHGDPIVDVGMRMLTPRELYRAQGFPDSFNIDGFTARAQVRMAGNSVCPQVAAAIVRANIGAQRGAEVA